LVYLLPDFGYPVYALWFTCSQILAILFMLFGLLEEHKQDSQSLEASKPKRINRIAKIWEQVNQRA
jgi:hypothetical protein